jgi:hypothetical protein
MKRLLSARAPFLPLATTTYNKNQQDQFADALRLYFNQLDNAVGSVVGTFGGQYIDNPHGLFFSTTDQTGSTGAQAIEFELTYLSNGVRVNAGTESRIYVDIPGVYNFQFSGQLVSSDAASKQVYIWIVRDGTDIGYSTHQYTVSGSNNHLEISWNFNIDLKAGQYLELEWAISTGTVSLETTAATSPHPGIPSTVIAVSYVAPLPDTLPTPP